MEKRPYLTIEEANWSSAEVFQWKGQLGELIARLRITSSAPTKCVVDLESGGTLPGRFRSPEDALTAIEAHLEGNDK
jgi:hypothetical protein